MKERGVQKRRYIFKSSKSNYEKNEINQLIWTEKERKWKLTKRAK